MTSVLSYYVRMTGWPVALLIAVLRAASWMLALSLTVSAARYLPLTAAVFVLPSVIAACELVAQLVSPHGSAGSLAYSQMDVVGVVQVAALGGTCAVVFLLLLPGSLVGLCVFYRFSRAERWRAGALVSVIVVATALFSAARLRAPHPGGTVPVALIATSRYDGELAG